MKATLASFLLMYSSALLLGGHYATGQLRSETYDLVIHGGRVIDPETGLDAIRDVGIQGSTISAVSSEVLRGKRIINAEGLVVSPGFIDLHQHGQTPEDYRLKAFDGVTSALEMEIGARDISAFLTERSGGALINYGATANYDAARASAFHDEVPEGEILPHAGPGTNDPATPEQILQIEGPAAAADRGRSPGNRHGHSVCARCHPSRSHPGFSTRSQLSPPGLHACPKRWSERSRVKHRCCCRSDRRGRRHRSATAHRSHQQQLPHTRATLPRNASRSTCSRARHNDRGLSLYRWDDTNQLSSLQPRLAREVRHHIWRSCPARHRGALNRAALRTTSRRSSSASRPDLSQQRVHR